MILKHILYGLVAAGFCIVVWALFIHAGKRKHVLKGGIRRKIALTFALLAFTVTAAGVFLGYLTSYWLVEGIVIDSQRDNAQMVAEAMSRIVNEEAEDVRVYSEIIFRDNGSWKKTDQSLRQKYPDSALSGKLRSIVNSDTGLLEFFATDQEGDLLAASGETSDLYQADELWWQRAIGLDKGEIFIGDVEYDSSAGEYGISMAMCVFDDNGAKKGVAKSVLSVDRLFGPLERLALEEGKLVKVVNESGKDVFSAADEAGNTTKFGLEQEKISAFLESGEKGETMLSAGQSPVSVFVVAGKVDNVLLSANKIEWWVVLGQEKATVFKPLKILLLQAAMLVVVLAIILVLGIWWISIYLSKPVRDFNESVRRIAGGDMGHRVDIRTGDEIEELAGNVNRMVDNILKATVSRDDLAKEVEDRKVAEKELQESRAYLKEKTIELEKALEESVKTRSRMISMLDDNNQTRQKLEGSLAELKETQGMLVQSEKLVSLGRLVSEMAHEVNNPLMIISSRAQLLQMGDLKPEDMEDSVAIIERQCYRARDIIQRLLKFSKPSASGTEEVDVNTVIEEAVKLLEHQYSLENVTIERNYAKSLPSVQINKNEMEEVFLNLIKNAAEAMPDGGKITVSTLGFKGKVRIVFKDTGEGMSQRVINNIFDPFFTTKKEGTGLGLSVCYGIIKGHGGSLDYESSKGEGTSAIIMLPPAKKTS